MTDKHSKQAQDYFQARNQELRMLIGKANQLKKLNEKFSILIDENIRLHCQVANFEGSKLIIIASNGSIATQLRFQLPDLLRQCRQDPLLQRVKEIQCKVSLLPPQPSFRSEKKTREVSLLSTETAELIADIAASLEDPKLREIMARIATRKRIK